MGMAAWITRTAAVIAVGAALAGCTGEAAAPAATQTPTPGPDVVHLNGFRDIAFGASAIELAGRGRATQDPAGCGWMFTDGSAVGPSFDADRLVLLWFNAPLHTPEGVTTGDPVEKARVAYPGATALAAPAGTYRFDGLLSVSGDRAYLFLHDGKVIQKAIAGYADAARQLFESGHGEC